MNKVNKNGTNKSGRNLNSVTGGDFNLKDILLNDMEQEDRCWSIFSSAYPHLELSEAQRNELVFAVFSLYASWAILQDITEDTPDIDQQLRDNIDRFATLGDWFDAEFKVVGMQMIDHGQPVHFDTYREFVRGVLFTMISELWLHNAPSDQIRSALQQSKLLHQATCLAVDAIFELCSSVDTLSARDFVETSLLATMREHSPEGATEPVRVIHRMFFSLID